MRKEKQLLLDAIKGQFEQSGTFLLMRYAGLTANLAVDFRDTVVGTGGNVEILGKRMLMKAADELGFTLDRSVLDGHIGVIFAGEDAVETTKAVYKFAKENANTLEVVAGRFDGQLYTGSQVAALSKLPGKDEMRAQFLGLLEAPMAHTLSAMEALLASVCYCLDNKCKQAEQS
jgi:large subunit ribosomal protein L10